MTNAKERNMSTVLVSLTQWFASGKMYGPSYRDLSESSGLPIGTVHKTCKMLRDGGVIDFDENIARSIRFVKEDA